MTTNYRPENVKVIHNPEGWHGMPSFPFMVIDFDGTPMRAFKTRSEAEAARRVRAGVIKGALTRRANKARKG